jgi:hypothetical protein
MKIVITFFLLLSVQMIFGQTAKLLLMKPIFTKPALIIHYDILNGDTAKIFYKITKIAFCAGLANLEITDSKTKNKELYFPCEGLIDLKTVTFNNENSFLLNSRSVYKSTLLIKLNDLSPLIKGHTYSIQLSFNYNNLPTESKEAYYNSLLTSNKLWFVY